jgi:hypothetical protein
VIAEVLSYALGVGANIVARASLAVRDKNSGIDSWGKYARLNLAALVLRTLLASGYFAWWLHDPQLVSHFFDFIGSFFSGGTKTFLESIEFPLNGGTALLYGLAADSVIDKLLRYFNLEKTLPQVIGGV